MLTRNGQALALNGQRINDTVDMVNIPNLQFAYIAVWYTGEKDFYSFTSEAKFKRHISQWSHNEGAILWRSDRPTGRITMLREDEGNGAGHKG